MTAAAVVEPELIDVPQSMTLPALNPLALLNKLIDKNPEPDQLGKMIALVENWKKQRAIEAYAVAMARCQAEIPPIEKTALNKQKNSKYSPLEEVQRVAMPVINRNGFSPSFSHDPAPDVDGRNHIVLDIFHSEGHRERLHGYYRLDGKGAKGGDVMSDIQGDVSTHSYAQRDMLRMAFSLQIGGLDRDGQETEYVSEQDVGEINLLMDECKKAGRPVDLLRFLQWLEVTSLQLLTTKDFGKAVHFLRCKRDGVKA